MGLFWRNSVHNESLGIAFFSTLLPWKSIWKNLRINPREVMSNILHIFNVFFCCCFFLARTTGNVEREVTDNLIAEVTRESPFMDDDNFDQVN